MSADLCRAESSIKMGRVADVLSGIGKSHTATLMANRPPIPKKVETDVLTSCRRRCCLCFYLLHLDQVKKGQIAHLNGDPADNRLDNLAYLCLDHHDEFDSTTSQSKGLSPQEVRHYRDRLNSELRARVRPANDVGSPSSDVIDAIAEMERLPNTDVYKNIRKKEPQFSKRFSRPWHFPIGQVANEPEYFAYLAGNYCDGVCLIERIDLPDGRIVIACIEPPGNPGMSVTNAVEELAFQVCERFNIPPERLVWLEHYDLDGNGEWSWVIFKERPPTGLFQHPTWLEMTDQLWASLWLRPRKSLRPASMFAMASKLEKLFPWP